MSVLHSETHATGACEQMFEAFFLVEYDLRRCNSPPRPSTPLTGVLAACPGPG
jgi:hypothetical protein